MNEHVSATNLIMTLSSFPVLAPSQNGYTFAKSCSTTSTIISTQRTTTCMCFCFQWKLYLKQLTLHCTSGGFVKRQNAWIPILFLVWFHVLFGSACFCYYLYSTFHENTLFHWTPSEVCFSRGFDTWIKVNFMNVASYRRASWSSK